MDMENPLAFLWIQDGRWAVDGYKGITLWDLVVTVQFCIFIMVVVAKSYTCEKIAQNYRDIHIDDFTCNWGSMNTLWMTSKQIS